MILGQAPFSSCDNFPAQPLSSAHCFKDGGHPSCSWLPGHSPDYTFTPTANRFSVLADPDKSSTYSPWHSNPSTSNANLRRRCERAGKRHKIQRKSAAVAKLRTTESIVAHGHKVPTQCLEDNSLSTTEDPRGLNQIRRLSDITISLYFAIYGSDWLPQLQSDTLPTTLQFTNPPPPGVKSCPSMETLTSSSQPSKVLQKRPRLFTASRFPDCNDATCCWPSKSAFPQPLETTKVSQGSNSLAESVPLFFARQKELVATGCGHDFKKPLFPILSPEDVFDSRQTDLAIPGLTERRLVAAPSQAAELKSTPKLSTQRSMDAPPVSVSVGDGTEVKHAKKTYRRRPAPLSCLQAFGGFHSAFNPFLYDNWIASPPTTPLPPPWSVSHLLRRAYSMESHPFSHNDPASMGYSNAYYPTTASFTCPCLLQNYESRGGSFPSSVKPAGNLNMRYDSGGTVCFGVMSIPTGPTTSRSPDEVRAQQVDSIFANRNPWANGRLRSRPPITSRYCLDYWMRVSSKGWRKDIHSVFDTPNQEPEPEEEWVSIPREFDQSQKEDNIDNVLNAGSDQEYEVVQRNTTLYDLDGWERIGRSLIAEMESCDFDEDGY